MGIKELIGMEPERKVRYAIVGLGDIAQEDMMPGVEHTGNSEITALVTSDSAKAKELGREYGVDSVFSYEKFTEALDSGTFDAIYLATPNWRHAEFIVPALKAGIHVLTEKPLEVSTAKCKEILEVAARSNAKLMVAYRLHFEPATLDTIDKIQNSRRNARRSPSVCVNLFPVDRTRQSSGQEWRTGWPGLRHGSISGKRCPLHL
jgi:predicted dehydrogenase